MDEQDYVTARWPIWLAAIGISVVATLGEFLGSSLSPFVAPYVCAAALGLRLPRRQFFILVAILSCAITLPLLAYGFDSQQLTHRGIGLACLAVIAVSRWKLEPRSDQCDSEVLGIPEEDIPEANMVSEPLTHVRDTEHRVQEDREGDFSLEPGLPDDFLSPALERLKTDGEFNHHQMQLIETEMRSLESHNIAVNYASSLQKGVQIGRFVIDDALGRGGEGNVYRGHDESGEPAAIKILHNMRVSDRFRREMHLVRRLAHPNIVTAYEVGEFRGLPFITMELLRGPDLHVLVRDSGPLNWMVSTQYILQAARALAHAHRRDLIHRDIKPGNLILNGDDTVKLVDLGLAAMCGNDTGMDSVFQFETKEGHLAGTLPYMAPEQARSLANATVRSDIYALGATWFYLVTGMERLRGKSFSKQFENLLVRRRFNALPDECMPESLRNIYRRMVAYNVSDRYESCEELTEELERVLETAGEKVCVEGINVLVVEDSRTDMLFTIGMLRRSNSTLTIHQSRTLADGLGICKQMSIDLVLLDLTLPDSAGVETVTRFREVMPEVPLVVLTGLSQEEVGAACLAAGADTFISKSGITAHRMERTIFVTLSRRGLMSRLNT